MLTHHLDEDRERLRVQISECELIRDLATDPVKRATFDKLAAHFKVLAGELENAIAKTPALLSDTAQGNKDGKL